MVRFQVLAGAIIKMAVFLVAAPSGLEEIALVMETANTSETLLNFYQNSWCNNPEDSRLHQTFRLKV
jgi:hypothetical protein